ncbi:hypothetical protein [Brevundimonas aurantiaca]|jgi:hypothetical protein|uniref:hypothetical protein n=1 Tax=Brevundimonas aurantiaca TaxID=74316 RepID=UPI003019E3FE
MKRSSPGPNIHHLAACVLYAPGLSLVAFFACVLLASIPQALTGGVDGGGVSIDAIFSGVVSLIALFILVTLWGLIPALLFGGVGCWLAERSLQARAWWAWGLAGSASASVYVVVSLICRSFAPTAGFLMAPWMFRAGLTPGAEGVFGALDMMLAASVAGILTGGFLAGALYFRLCRGRWAPIGADKRM